MLLWLTHTTSIRVTELALLEVADVLHPGGDIKPEVYLRSDITKGLPTAQCVSDTPTMSSCSGRLDRCSLTSLLGPCG